MGINGSTHNRELMQQSTCASLAMLFTSTIYFMHFKYRTDVINTTT